MNKTRKGPKILKKFLKFFDLYGQNVNLYVDKNQKFYSACSGFFSILIILLLLYIFAGVIISWVNKEKVTVITSSINYGVSQLLGRNQNDEYELNFKNFNVYFMVRAILPNGSALVNEQLSRYVTYNFTYVNETLDSNPLEWEYCNNQNYDIFLGLDEEKIKSDVGVINKNRICIKNAVKMGLFPNLDVQRILQPEIHFSIYECQNYTDSSNCASQEEIDKILKNLNVQASIPSTLYDFQNVQAPQKNFYEFQFIAMDKSMFKYYENHLVPTMLYTDYGLIFEDYRLEETNFNPNVFYDPRIRQQYDALFDYNFVIGTKLQVYHQRNQRLNDIVGSLGGIINAIFLTGKVFCLSYNSLSLKYKIIKETFLHPVHKENIAELYSKASQSPSNKFNIKLKRRGKFLCFRYLLPSKKLRDFYDKGAKRLHEYLDIRKIIKRLQDLDKLKTILLNENQRKLFEFIPKPDVLNNIESNNNSITIDFRNGKVKTKMKEQTIVPNNIIKFVQEEDPINKRIIECIDQGLKRNYSLSSTSSLLKITVLLKNIYLGNQNEGFSNINDKSPSKRINFNRVNNKN